MGLDEEAEFKRAYVEKFKDDPEPMEYDKYKVVWLWAKKALNIPSEWIQ